MRESVTDTSTQSTCTSTSLYGAYPLVNGARDSLRRGKHESGINPELPTMAPLLEAPSLCLP